MAEDPGKGSEPEGGAAAAQGGASLLDTRAGLELVAPPAPTSWRSAPGAQQRYAAAVVGGGGGKDPMDAAGRTGAGGRKAPLGPSASVAEWGAAARGGGEGRSEAGPGEQRSPGPTEHPTPSKAKKGGGKARANSVDSSGSGAGSPMAGGAKEKRRGHSSRFALDHDRIYRGEDRRTTVMVRNIPNKYTQQLLLQELDETLHGTFDWLYLPIDFKNRCNIGYAFVNFVHPRHIVKLSQEFSGKRWRRFNSDKVCDVTYARIQGKDELIRHFQKSAVMTEKEEYRPLLFRTDPGREGEQIPFSAAAAAAVSSPASSSSTSAHVTGHSPSRSISSGGGGGTPRARPENWADRVREGATRARRRVSSSGDSVLSIGVVPTNGSDPGRGATRERGGGSRVRANTGDSNDTSASRNSGGRRRSKRRGGRRRNKQ